MDDEVNADLQKCLSDGPMETDEGPLINENSNGLSHLLTEGEFNSVDAVVVDESSASNQGFLNAVELSAGSVGDYLSNNAEGFNTDSFDIGDNAITFPSDSMNNVLSDGDSMQSNSVDKMASVDIVDTDGDVTENEKSRMETELEQEIVCEISNDVISELPHDVHDNDSATGDINLNESTVNNIVDNDTNIFDKEDAVMIFDEERVSKYRLNTDSVLKVVQDKRTEVMTVTEKAVKQAVVKSDKTFLDDKEASKISKKNTFGT
ncbi:hypothetical protein ACJJTC_003405 [Scirpophaga incertulas]